MDKLYLALFYIFKFIITITPNSVHNAIVKFLASIYMRLNKRRFKVVMTNLNLAFGDEISMQRKLEIAKQCYINFAKFLGINFIKNQNTTKEKVLKKVCFKNENFLIEAINSKRPVIISTAHFGEWELFSLAMAARFGAVSVLGRRLDSKSIDKILNANRTQFDVELIDKQGATKGILKALKQGRIVGILVDQNTAKSDGIEISFFNKRVLHTPSVSIFAQKTDALIVNAFISQIDENLSEICFFESIDITKFDKENAIKLATQAQADACEAMIRQKPDEYFWFHRRFKRFYKEAYL
ncbi:lipid A biosynthesis acyltransferase [Campylobacter mucosalis]|uniref:Lipid A biosynthesis lauroyl acyltransferase n=1 Tax=Campylobacter mucosalis CCUG 21559 TaxID=1032067 RepID=A0A6G5QFP8_9BACT|nr:lipid A biosynthesis lauroyl acyltransferase [Campylobacter mucosalis]KEA45603.1 lipid A biosynthesis acyltransferase [Campylobacter mucosalis]QCD44500.1 lipid A biosynthesis lauroyl acyltransferase [Campylobacter mucosalis CCUG 21559]QKF62466.1 lipid A biosynthesis lauroyl acyltransferase [Campylobacter mucosalis]